MLYCMLANAKTRTPLFFRKTFLDYFELSITSKRKEGRRDK